MSAKLNIRDNIIEEKISIKMGKNLAKLGSGKNFGLTLISIIKSILMVLLLIYYLLIPIIGATGISWIQYRHINKWISSIMISSIQGRIHIFSKPDKEAYDYAKN